VPSAWARVNAPKPACQICWAESLTEPDSGTLSFSGLIFVDFGNHEMTPH